jgi:hypothetical protein
VKMFFAPRALTAQLALSLAVGCSSAAAPARPAQSDTVRLVEQAEFDSIRDSGEWVFEPRGEASASEPCASGSVDEQCINAAHARLRAAAIERGANLVRLLPGSTLQSYPPRYAISGELYQIRRR